MTASPPVRNRSSTWLENRSICQCWCYRILRRDNVAYRFTSHDRRVRFLGGVYEPTPGISVRDTRSTEGLEDKTSELIGIIDSSSISLDIIKARWLEGARVFQYAVDWRRPMLGYRLHNIFLIKAIQSDGIQWTAELRGWTSLLKRKVGGVYERTCKNELGVVNLDRSAGPISFCGVDLSYPRTVTTASVKAGSVTSNRQFTLTSPTSAGLHLTTHFLDYFALGRIEFIDGNNGGLKEQIASSTVPVLNGSAHEMDVTLTVPMRLDVDGGEQVTIVQGCPKTPSFCDTEFSAYDTYYRGFEGIPGNDALLASGDAT